MSRQLVRVALVGMVVLASTVAAPHANADSPPTISVTPFDGLADRQVVTVDGSGFTSDLVSAVECIAGHDPSGPGCLNGYSRSPLTGAGFSTRLEVRRSIPLVDPSTGTTQAVDCAVAPGTCEIVGTSVIVPSGTATQSINFDPDVAALPAPTMSVSKSTGLADGDVVEVAGQHYPPDGRVGVVQCRSGHTDVDSCDFIHGQLPFADSAGNVSVSAHLVQVLTMGLPPGDPTSFDCGTAAGACDLVVVFAGDLTEGGAVPLSFGEPATTSTTAPTTTTSTSTTSTTTTPTGATPAEAVVATPTFTG